MDHGGIGIFVIGFVDERHRFQLGGVLQAPGAVPNVLDGFAKDQLGDVRPAERLAADIAHSVRDNHFPAGAIVVQQDAVAHNIELVSQAVQPCSVYEGHPAHIAQAVRQLHMGDIGQEAQGGVVRQGGNPFFNDHRVQGVEKEPAVKIGKVGHRACARDGQYALLNVVAGTGAADAGGRRLRAVTALGAGGDQDVVILQIRKLVAVVELDRPHRTGKNGQIVGLAEEREAGVHRAVFADGIHVQAHVLPGIVVSGGHGSGALGARTGHGVFAGPAIANRTGFTIWAAAGAGGL